MVQDALAIPAGTRTVSTRVAPILGWAVLVAATLGLAVCVVMYAWGVEHFTEPLLTSTIELHTDRLLEADVPQPVIECMRVGEPIESADLALLDLDTRDLVQVAVGGVESVRHSTLAAAATGRRSALMVAMLCTGMGLVGLVVVRKARLS